MSDLSSGGSGGSQVPCLVLSHLCPPLHGCLPDQQNHFSGGEFCFGMEQFHHDIVLETWQMKQIKVDSLVELGGVQPFQSASLFLVSDPRALWTLLKNNHPTASS